MNNHDTLAQIIGQYDPHVPLESARTIPSAWYTDERVFNLEQESVFARHWQPVARCDQLTDTGSYVTATIGADPIVIVRGADGELRAFYNVCRHHATQIAAGADGCTKAFRCPYHGWTYGLDGTLKTTPEFAGVDGFDKKANGLVPVRVDKWAPFVFVCTSDDTPGLHESLGDLPALTAPLNLSALRFVERRTYEIACNWKVFVDNYLDGGYHVPYAHKSLSSVLDYSEYKIECRGNLCIQTSPIDAAKGDARTAAVRSGKMAYYYWLHPNFMLNCYEGYMDTNLVLPLGVDRTLAVFDFYFADSSAPASNATSESLAVAERVQQEDIDLCELVQRGLRSRAYDTGRLSVRREAGEQLFHRLLHRDLTAQHG